MTSPVFEELIDEARREQIGRLWLAEIRSACADVARQFDPLVYAVSERSWSGFELDELVQDVLVDHLLTQGQLRYILDVAASVEEIRRLLRHQVRRALIRRRRRTVVDQLLVRIGRLLAGDGFEVLPSTRPARWRPKDSDLPARPLGRPAVAAAVGAVRMLPKSTADGDRAPAVYRSDVLAQLVDLAFATTRTSLSTDDFGTILRDVLTSWIPVVLEDIEGFDASSAPPADLPLGLKETVEAVLTALDEVDRTVLRIKLSGEPDSALAIALGVSRPTAAKRKVMAFDRLRAAWIRTGGREVSDSVRIAEEIYARLQSGGSDGA